MLVPNNVTILKNFKRWVADPHFDYKFHDSVQVLIKIGINWSCGLIRRKRSKRHYGIIIFLTFMLY